MKTVRVFFFRRLFLPPHLLLPSGSNAELPESVAPLPVRGPSELCAAGGGDRGLEARLSEFGKSSFGGGLLPDWYTPVDKNKHKINSLILSVKTI